jgi:hypothetical protein
MKVVSNHREVGVVALDGLVMPITEADDEPIVGGRQVQLGDLIDGRHAKGLNGDGGRLLA